MPCCSLDNMLINSVNERDAGLEPAPRTCVDSAGVLRSIEHNCEQDGSEQDIPAAGSNLILFCNRPAPLALRFELISCPSGSEGSLKRFSFVLWACSSFNDVNADKREANLAICWGGDFEGFDAAFSTSFSHKRQLIISPRSCNPLAVKFTEQPLQLLN